MARITPQLRIRLNQSRAAVEFRRKVIRRQKLCPHGEPMPDDQLNAEESAGLLHLIFPNYPDLQGMKSPPEIAAFLRSMREGTAASSNHFPLTDTTH
jgi:hypothetical protein